MSDSAHRNQSASAPRAGTHSTQGSESQDPRPKASISIFEGAYDFRMSNTSINNIAGNQYQTENNNNSRTEGSHNTYNTTNTGSQNQSHAYSGTAADNRHFQSTMWKQSVNLNDRESDSGFGPRPTGEPYYDDGRPSYYEPQPPYRPNIHQAPYSDSFLSSQYAPPPPTRNQPGMLPYPYQPPGPLHPLEMSHRYSPPQSRNPYNVPTGPGGEFEFPSTNQLPQPPYTIPNWDNRDSRYTYDHHRTHPGSPSGHGHYYPSPPPSELSQSPPGPYPREFPPNSDSMVQNHKRFNPFVNQAPQAPAYRDVSQRDHYSRSAPPTSNRPDAHVDMRDVDMSG